VSDPSRACTFTTYERDGAVQACHEGAYRRGLSLLAVALVTVLALSACSTATPVASPSCSNSPSAPPPCFHPASFGPPPSANGNLTSITIDTTLLAVLPREVSSIPIIESPEGEADALADPVLPTIATAAVAAVAVDTQTSDLVYVLVVRLRPDAFTEDTYRDWRDSYDEGACGGVSNVVGHSQTSIGGRTVYIGTCASGLRTYHTRVEAQSILISASATGDRQFGILLVGNLRT
jgi:hypothetical protein